RVDNEIIALALLLVLHPVVGSELSLRQRALRHECSDLTRDVGYVELLHPTGAVLPLQQQRPGCINAATQWSDETQACDHDAAHDMPCPMPSTCSGRRCRSTAIHASRLSARHALGHVVLQCQGALDTCD